MIYFTLFTLFIFQHISHLLLRIYTNVKLVFRNRRWKIVWVVRETIFSLFIVIFKNEFFWGAFLAREIIKSPTEIISMGWTYEIVSIVVSSVCRCISVHNLHYRVTKTTVYRIRGFSCSRCFRVFSSIC